MQVHQLKKNSTFKDKKRVGRGGKKGTYCGSGGKGQKGRSGARFKPIIREWLKKYPKLRGYNFNTRDGVSVINVSDLENMFEKGSTINPTVLIAERIIRRVDGKNPSIKILGNGEVTKSFVIEGCILSAKAKEKLEKAGSTIKE